MPKDNGKIKIKCILDNKTDFEYNVGINPIVVDKNSKIKIWGQKPFKGK